MLRALEPFLIAASLILPVRTAVGQVAAASDQDIARIARHQGNELAAALLREDYAGVAATACSPVLARVGGARALEHRIEVGFKVMQQQGRKLLAMQFGTASAIYEASATRFALVPYRSRVRVRGGSLSIESYYLGVQDKGADTWCFIDTAALTPDILRDMYPGAPADLILPPPSKPVLELAGAATGSQ